MIPEQLSVADLAEANAKGRAWCAEVNATVHTEIMAVPAERLAIEAELFSDLPSLRAQIGKIVTRKVDKLSCVPVSYTHLDVYKRQRLAHHRPACLTSSAGPTSIGTDTTTVPPGATSPVT